MPNLSRLFADSIVIDGLGPIFWYQDEFEPYLDRVVASGVTAFNHTMAVPYDFRPDTIEDLKAEIDRWEGYADRFSDRLMIIRSTADIHEAKRTGRTGVIYGLQNLQLLEGDLAALERLRAMDILIAGLTYQGPNELGCGSGVPEDTGLTAFGRDVVVAMNELGMLVCVSHVGERTALDAIEASSKPVAFTHINARCLASTVKNISDEEILAVGKKGGVIGIASWSPNVSTEPRPGLPEFLAHVQHVGGLISPEQTGIGLDLAEGLPPERLALIKKNFPENSETTWEDMYVPAVGTVEKWPVLATELGRIGYTPEQIRHILGGSFLRVFDAVWR